MFELYRISWDEKARDFLRTLPKEDVKRIVKRLDSILSFPEHYLEVLVQVNAFKLRVGNYRIIIDLDRTNELIRVLFVGHRKNVYDAL